MPAASSDLRIAPVPQSQIPLIRELNATIFGDSHIIRTFDRPELLILVAWLHDDPVGFKIGYQLDPNTFYSAKGGVIPSARRQGIARALLHAMINEARTRSYARFVFDTFPNKHPGMTILALNEGFKVIRAGYNTEYHDYRLRFAYTLRP